VLVEGEVLINFIGEDQSTRMGLDKRGNFLELGTSEYFPRGVLGGVEEEEPCLWGEGCGEFVPV